MIIQVIISGLGAFGALALAVVPEKRVWGWQLVGVLFIFYAFVGQVLLAILGVTETKTIDWNLAKIIMLVIVVLAAILGPIFSFKKQS